MLDIEEFKKKLDKKSRLIGIDPGKKRIGIAISDENKIVATPYKTVIKKDYFNFLAEIKKIVFKFPKLISLMNFNCSCLLILNLISNFQML